MTEAAMRDVPVKEPRLFCTYCGVGCSFDNGRILEHFHEGNMTYRAPGIQQETPERLG
jgi:predicted molibdopterin-dependent oxidoreductase YjgC